MLRVVPLNGNAGGQPIVPRVDRAERVSSGDHLPIRWHLDQALVFDALSGERL